MAEDLDKDLFDTTRGKVLLLLCRGPQTVNELMNALGLTDNAVRAQLANLQQAGLVRQLGLRPGVRKPHVDYELTPAARRLFPQAHEQALRTLLRVLWHSLPPEQSTAVLKETARQILQATFGPAPAAGPGERLATMLDRVRNGTSAVTVEEEPGRVAVRACGCPLASITAEQPRVCEALAEALTEMVGVPVREKCDRADVPRCCFEVETGRP